MLDRVESETASLDQALAAAQREIALLREYRTRLITDVVTGQVDVRAAAAGLADEENELDVDDAMEELDGVEIEEAEETEDEV